MSGSSDSLKGSRRVDRDTIDVLVLIVAFVSGIGASIGLKMFNFPIWLPALVSAAIIAAYAVITYNTRSARLEPDQIGDNAYYLGFVFTLTALGHTIYELDPNAEAASLREVISGFGVALSSTIVGVATRVILLQYRVDLTAREGEVRMQLNDAAREFHTELADVIRSTKLVSTEIRQHLEEHHKEVAAAHEQRTAAMIEELVEAFKQSFDEIVEQGKETNRRLVDSARTAIADGEKAAGQSLETVSRRMEETSATLVSAMKTLTEGSRTAIETSSVTHSQNIADHERMMRESNDSIAASSKSLQVAMDQLATQSREMIDATASTQSESAKQHQLVTEQLANQSREIIDIMARTQSEIAISQQKAMQQSADQLSASVKDFVETVSTKLAEFEKKAAVAESITRTPDEPQSTRWFGLKKV